MNTTLICAVVATMISFSSAWLLARFSVAALLLCMPRASVRPVLADGGKRPCA